MRCLRILLLVDGLVNLWYLRNLISELFQREAYSQSGFGHMVVVITHFYTLCVYILTTGQRRQRTYRLRSKQRAAAMALASSVPYVRM